MQQQQQQLYATSAREDDAPYIPQADLLVVMISSALLAFVATPVMYAAYAATQQGLYMHRGSPISIVTDMLGNWPVLSVALLASG